MAPVTNNFWLGSSAAVANQSPFVKIEDLKENVLYCIMDNFTFVSKKTNKLVYVCVLDDCKVFLPSRFTKGWDADNKLRESFFLKSLFFVYTGMTTIPARDGKEEFSYARVFFPQPPRLGIDCFCDKDCQLCRCPNNKFIKCTCLFKGGKVYNEANVLTKFAGEDVVG